MLFLDTLILLNFYCQIRLEQLESAWKSLGRYYIFNRCQIYSPHCLLKNVCFFKGLCTFIWGEKQPNPLYLNSKFEGSRLSQNIQQWTSKNENRQRNHSPHVLETSTLWEQWTDLLFFLVRCVLLCNSLWIILQFFFVKRIVEILKFSVCIFFCWSWGHERNFIPSVTSTVEIITKPKMYLNIHIV